MAQPTFDDGIENLQRFCTLLGETHGILARDLETLEARGHRLERAQAEVRERGEHLAERLETSLQALAEAQTEALEETERLGEAARSLAEVQLGEASEHVHRDEVSFEERTGHDRDGLEKDFVDLEGAGFAALTAALDGLEAELAAAGEEAAEALGTLHQGVTELAERADHTRGEAAAALDAAEDRLRESQVQEWEPQVAEHVAFWTEELPEAVQARCEAVGDPLETLYDAWEQEVVAEADELTGAVGSFVQAATASVAEEAAQPLAEATERTTEGALQALGGELDDLLAPLAEGEEAADAAAALVDDLVVTRRIVGEIDQLLNALQG